jgi:2-deoxy-D-gluconate 3-dehydrogenase
MEQPPGSPFNLEGEVIIVTGGNTGLGAAMAEALEGAGAHVAIVGRSVENQSVGSRRIDLNLNVTDERGIVRAFERIRATFGNVTGLVNNAGFYRDMRLSDEDFTALWQEMLDVNLTGAALCTHVAVPFFREAGRGCIVNVGSAYSLFGHHKSAGYTAAKTGLLGLSRAAAAELGRTGIRVNTILPGWIDTKMNAGLIGSPRGDYIQNATPLGRWGSPNDVAGAVVFLCSRAAAFITGAELRIDGGYSVSDRDYNHR